MWLARTLVLAAIAISLAIANPMLGYNSWNDGSRMATASALVEHGTFAIDRTSFVNTGDKIFVGGHFYSDKPPLPSIMAAAVYLPLYHLGLELSHGRNKAYYVIVVLTMKGVLLLALFCFYFALKRTGLSDGTRILLTGALALSSLLLPWTAVFNNHGLAAGFVTVGLYSIIEARHRDNARALVLVAGLFFSLASVCDLSTGAIFAAFGMLVIATKKLRPYAVWYFLPCLVTFVPYLTFNYLISGSVLPVQLNEQLFMYPGSPWIDFLALSGVRANDLGTALHIAWLYLFGPNGFVLYNPLLFVAIPLTVREVWRRGPFWREALATLGASGVIFVFYVATTTNESGASYSIRWFVPLLPLLLFFLYPFFETLTKLRAVAFAALATASLVIAGIGVVDPWSEQNTYESAFLYNLGKVFDSNG